MLGQITLPGQYGLNPLAPQPAPLVCQGLFSCLILFFSVVFKFLTLISGALAVIMFAWAGIMLIVGRENKVAYAKNSLIWGALGLILALVSYGLVVMIEKFVSKPKLGFLNFALAQSLRFSPQPIGCSSFTILNILEGAKVPSGLLSKCTLWLAQKTLTFLYTLSLLLAVGFLIYGGIRYIVSQKAEEANKMIFFALIGIFVTIIAYTLVRAIEFTLVSK